MARGNKGSAVTDADQQMLEKREGGGGGGDGKTERGETRGKDWQWKTF